MSISKEIDEIKFPLKSYTVISPRFRFLETSMIASLPLSLSLHHFAFHLYFFKKKNFYV